MICKRSVMELTTCWKRHTLNVFMLNNETLPPEAETR